MTAPCVAHPACTGKFDPAKATGDYTGWTYDPDEGDVPVHDCVTIAQRYPVCQNTLAFALKQKGEEQNRASRRPRKKRRKR